MYIFEVGKCPYFDNGPCLTFVIPFGLAIELVVNVYSSALSSIYNVNCVCDVKKETFGVIKVNGLFIYTKKYQHVYLVPNLF